MDDEAKIRVLTVERDIFRDCLIGSRCQNKKLKNKLAGYEFKYTLDYGDSYDRYKKEYNEGSLKPKEMFIMQMMEHGAAKLKAREQKLIECVKYYASLTRYQDKQEKDISGTRAKKCLEELGIKEDV